MKSLKIVMKYTLQGILFSMIMAFSIGAISEKREGKAVYEMSSDLGIKLTEKAIINIEVKSSKIDANNQLKIPSDALVYFQDQIGVYRLRDGWYKLIPIKVLKKDGNSVAIQKSEFKAGDEVVIHGADLLRVSEMDALGGGE